MTGSTGTPSTGIRSTGVADRSVASRPDTAAAATTETTRPSAEKILETGTEEVGAPTPAMNSPVDPATATGGGATAAQYKQSSEQTHELAERVRLNALRARDQARTQGLRGIRTAESFVRGNPLATLLGTLAAGFVLGALLSRTSGPARLRDYDYDDQDAYERDHYYD